MADAMFRVALCGPSRTSFLTSRRPGSLGVLDNAHSFWRTAAGNFTTLPQLFRQQGYQTLSLGKVFHPGPLSNDSDDYPLSWSRPPWHPPSQRQRNRCLDARGRPRNLLLCPCDVAKEPGGTLPDLETADEAVRQLRRLSERPREPFFLAIGFHKPHIPFKFPREYQKLYPLSNVSLAPDGGVPPALPAVAWNPWTDVRRREDIAQLHVPFPYGPLPNRTAKAIRAAYWSSVSYMDAQVGRVMDALRELRLQEKTWVMLSSDHGWSLGEHGEWAKYSLFQRATRVPLLLRPPAGLPATLRLPQLVELVDLLPSLAELVLGQRVPPCRSHEETTCTEGRSFARLLSRPGKSGRLAAFWQYPRPSLRPRPDSDEPSLGRVRYMGWAVRTRRWRYALWTRFRPRRGGGGGAGGDVGRTVAEELYDMSRDPAENLNVAGLSSLREVRKKLKRLLKRHYWKPLSAL